MANIEAEARQEAEKRWPDEHAYEDRDEFRALRAGFIAGALWHASRPREAESADDYVETIEWLVDLGVTPVAAEASLAWARPREVPTVEEIAEDIEAEHRISDLDGHALTLAVARRIHTRFEGGAR